MNWIAHQTWFAGESLSLRCIPLGLREAIQGGAKALIEWGLQAEWNHSVFVDRALVSWLQDGKWPKMEPLPQFLLSQRLLTASGQMELLYALGHEEVDRENAVVLLCMKHWNLLRYVSWLTFAGRQMSGPVHDPFDSITPPSWAQ